LALLETPYNVVFEEYQTFLLSFFSFLFKGVWRLYEPFT